MKAYTSKHRYHSFVFILTRLNKHMNNLAFSQLHPVNSIKISRLIFQYSARDVDKQHFFFRCV